MKPGASSATARVIAGAIVLAGRVPAIRPRPAPREVEWSARLLAHDPRARRLVRILGTRVGRCACRCAEAVLLPGIVRHYLCRKRWLERQWAAARAGGFGQLLVLGAGYDTLPLRLAEGPDPPATVEIDHPETQRTRRAVVESAGLPRPPRLIAADLSAVGLAECLPGALRGSLDARADLFVLAEGVLMYLEPRIVEAAFRSLAALPSPRVRFAFTFMEHPAGRGPAFRPQNPLVGLWLRLRGEPFVWGLETGRLEGWLSGLGWELVAYSPRPGRPGAEAGVVGESGAVAERGRSALERAGGPRWRRSE